MLAIKVVPYFILNKTCRVQNVNSEHSSLSAKRSAIEESSYGRDMVQKWDNKYAQCIFKIKWSGFLVHEITSVSGESELFPVGIGQLNETA